MNSYKKWTLQMLIVSALLLLTYALSVFIIDPAIHYRKPLPFLSYSFKQTNEVYLNPGFASQYSYDSVLTGSSMVENFRVSWFKDEMDSEAIKVPYGGATTKNSNIILTYAFEKNSEIEKVFWGLDLYALEQPYLETRTPIPYYMYDHDVKNDINYLLNKDVGIKQLLPNLLQTIRKQPSMDMDEAYTWDKEFVFSKEETLANYAIHMAPALEKHSEDYFLKNAEENLKFNIIPLIEDHPETDYYIFFPPYSILFWHDRIQKGQLDATFIELKYVIERLLEYNNVKIFYFQNIEEIITNLDLYKDYTHYNADINQFMVRAFAENNYRLNKDNYSDALQNMKNIVDTYDFETLLGE